MLVQPHLFSFFVNLHFLYNSNANSRVRIIGGPGGNQNPSDPPPRGGRPHTPAAFALRSWRIADIKIPWFGRVKALSLCPFDEIRKVLFNAPVKVSKGRLEPVLEPIQRHTGLAGIVKNGKSTACWPLLLCHEVSPTFLFTAG